MSATVKYKGNTLTTATNETRTLNTAGKYMEADVVITDVSQSAPALQTKTVSITPTTSAQSQAVTPDSGYDGLDEVDVNVSAMPTGSYGSPTWSTNKTSSYYNMSVSYPSFTAGYLASGPTTSSSLALENKTATPTTSSQTITPTSNSRYLESVTVNPIPSQYIVPSGTKSITANGTGIDVAEYAAVDVAVPSGAPNLQSKSKSYTPTETAQSETVTADAGYDGLSDVSVSVGAISSTYVGSGIARKSSSDLTASGATVTAPAGYYQTQATKTVASGSATAPASISGTAATVSTGTNTLTLTKTVSVTPTVTAGYVASGTAGNSSVSLQANVTTKAAATITPGTTNQTIASGTYLTGTQTISGDANLVAGNIKNGTSIFGVTGTYTGGGGSSDVVMGTLNVESNVNTSTSTQITTTSALGFTPTKFFFWKDERTATSNHVHQASFVTIGTSYYVRTMTRYSNNALSTSGNANNWTTQTAGYLYFNSNTVYFRSSSSYILSSGTWHWVAVK